MQQPPDIHISRHTAQSIWHDALTHVPHGFSGLLGKSADDPIDQAVTSVTMQNNEDFIRDTLATWQQQEIRPCGALYGSCDPALFASIEAMVASPSFVHIVISLDTEGRLDSSAYLLDAGSPLSVPLVMVEDGQTGSIR